MENKWENISCRAVDQSQLGPYRVRVGTTPQRLYAAEKYFPVLVFGPQRSGKTSGFAVPALIDWGGPAVVTSVRRDILDDTYQWRQSLGNVYIFDPSGSLARTRYNEFRHSWDILDHCRSWDDCVRMGRALTESGRTGGINGDDSFWYSLSAQLLAPYLFAAAAEGLGMTDVVQWVKTQKKEKVRKVLEDTGNVSALDSAEAVWATDERVRDSVYTTTRSVLRAFDYEDAGVDTPPFLDVDAFLASKADTLYICAPPDEQEEYRPLFTGLIRTIIRKTYDLNIAALDEGAESGTVDEASICHLLLLLDEAGNIAPLENLDTLATTAAGTRVQLVSIFHDLSQLSRVYDEFKARSIVNNHPARLVLSGMCDVATLSYFENILRGERVANSKDALWNGPRPIRGIEFGEALLVYGNRQPIVLSLRSRFTDDELLVRTRWRASR
ncbi:type IV secretory system conjugative DNA transfer family protein [Streptomyces zaehneri]|uniref:type IV secretory system conjugative DNA transfer family protein n=1 Tax=Streptomyces zaehneri TaxID=3051180 RepID=UPI0028D76756|nr:type IV secretory system conjugative DNA transfer family protein [Streptomyces sp. DSM 40713]